MSNKIIVELDASKIAQEIFDLVDRAYREKPDPKDIQALRRKLEELPELWKAVFHMTEVIRNNLIEKSVSPKAARMAIKKNVEALMDDMSYISASAIERLLIENVVITWLRLQWVEYQMVGFMGEGEVRISVVEFWEKRLSLSQIRHLRACETLAKVRKLMSAKPGVQVNIAANGGQQVNVAGDVIRNDQTM